MALYRVTNVGEIGVVSDIHRSDLAPNAWTYSDNARFEGGYVITIPTNSTVLSSVAVSPYHLLPMSIAGQNYVIYAGTQKIYIVDDLLETHTNLMRQTAGVDVNYAADYNLWSSCLFNGIPILTNGGDPPQSWDLNLANRCTTLPNWPASTEADVIRPYKNSLVALGVFKATGNYPNLVKWSHPADPGSVPSSWDHTDATKDAGEYDLSEGWDRVVDGLQLRDSFMIYKQDSAWRMDFIGGPYIYRFSKVPGLGGVLGKNCVVEYNGMHVVVTNNDVVIHDGSSSRSLLSNRVRKQWLRDQYTQEADNTFAVRMPMHDEVWISYQSSSAGGAHPDTQLVINLKTGATSFRTSQSMIHGAIGAVNDFNYGWTLPAKESSGEVQLAWSTDNIAGNAARCFIANKTLGKIQLTGWGGTSTTATVERRGLDLGFPQRRKLIRAVRPRIHGTAADTVTVSITSMATPYSNESVTQSQTYTIGTTYECPFTVEGRYFAIKFSGATTTAWRLDAYDIEYEDMGEW